MLRVSVSYSLVFDSSYTFIKVSCKQTSIPNNYIITHVYRFKSNKAIYICEVEEYKNAIFILKFYRKSDRLSKDKYNILTNEFNCSKIVGTCIRILLSILNQNNVASFGFLGAHTISKNLKEDKENTIRFRIYKSAMENLIGDEVFTHSMDTKNSTYLMMNKNNPNIDEFLSDAKQMFENIFPSLDY